jgi:hypothetical protein
VADERTAKLASGEPLDTRAYSSRICCSSCGGSAAASTQPRIAAPALPSACTSSTSTFASASSMRCTSLLCARKSSNALAVVAKPPGTRTPALESWLMSSPREAFLPPTCATSVMRRDSRGRT